MRSGGDHMNGRLSGPFFISDKCPSSVNPIRSSDVRDHQLVPSAGAFPLMKRLEIQVPPDPPEPYPASAFVIYAQHVRPSLPGQLSQFSTEQLMDVLGKQWKCLSERDRLMFENEYERRKRKYECAISDYYQTPAFVEYAKRQNLSEEKGSVLRPPSTPVPESVVCAQLYAQRNHLMASMMDSTIHQECSAREEMSTLKERYERYKALNAMIESEIANATVTFKERTNGIQRKSEWFLDELKRRNDQQQQEENRQPLDEIMKVRDAKNSTIETLNDDIWTSPPPPPPPQPPLHNSTPTAPLPPPQQQQQQRPYYYQQQRMTPQTWFSMNQQQQSTGYSQYNSPRQQPTTPYQQYPPPNPFVVRAQCNQGHQSPRLLIMPNSMTGMYQQTQSATPPPGQQPHPYHSIAVQEQLYRQSPSAYSHNSSVSPYPPQQQQQIDFQHMMQYQQAPPQQQQVEMYQQQPQNPYRHLPPPPPPQQQYPTPRMMMMMNVPSVIHQQAPVREMQNFVETVGVSSRRPNSGMPYEGGPQ